MKTLIFLFSFGILNAQGVLPLNRYYKPQGPLDLILQTSTFGYSLRKIKSSYSGFALKVRRNSTQNPEADIAFDVSEVVSGSSIVTITKSGDGLTVGQTLTLASFISTNQVFVVTWYDQGGSFNATQANVNQQPLLVLNTAGISNNKPSILFIGGSPSGSGKFLIINQPVQNILDQGIRGTFFWAIRPLANSAHFAFGFRNASTDWRWSFHVNWLDGNLYFDAAEVCCAANRAIVNGGNINLWKQYTIVRGLSYKTVRISGGTTGLNNAAASSTAQTGGAFHIGSALNNPNSTFDGNVSELIMFPTDIPLNEIEAIEKNQMAYWNL